MVCDILFRLLQRKNHFVRFIELIVIVNHSEIVREGDFDHRSGTHGGLGEKMWNTKIGRTFLLNLLCISCLRTKSVARVGKHEMLFLNI